jgi:hypothetical protein
VRNERCFHRSLVEIEFKRSEAVFQRAEEAIADAAARKNATAAA